MYFLILLYYGYSENESSIFWEVESNAVRDVAKNELYEFGKINLRFKKLNFLVLIKIALDF